MRGTTDVLAVSSEPSLIFKSGNLCRQPSLDTKTLSIWRKCSTVLSINRNNGSLYRFHFDSIFQHSTIQSITSDSSVAGDRMPKVGDAYDGWRRGHP